jgi:hypothetical protein
VLLDLQKCSDETEIVGNARFVVPEQQRERILGNENRVGPFDRFRQCLGDELGGFETGLIRAPKGPALGGAPRKLCADIVIGAGLWPDQRKAEQDTPALYIRPLRRKAERNAFHRSTLGWVKPGRKAAAYQARRRQLGTDDLMWQGGRATADFLNKDDAGKRHRAFSLCQFLRVRGIAGDKVVSLELIEAPVSWRKIERDRRFALGKALAPKGHRRSVSDPNLARLGIESVAEAKSGNLVATVKHKKLAAIAAGGRIGVVGRDNLSERVAFAND